MPATALSRRVANFFLGDDEVKVITIHELTRELLGPATKKNLRSVSKATRMAIGLLLRRDPPLVLATLWEKDLLAAASDTPLSESESEAFSRMRSSSRGQSCIAGYVVWSEETKGLVKLAIARQNNGTEKQRQRLHEMVQSAKKRGLLTEEESMLFNRQLVLPRGEN